MHFATDADWLDRLFERAPLPAWAVGAGLVAAILGAVALAQAVAGDPTRMEASVLGDRDLRVGLAVTALAGYTPAARHYLLRATARNLEALRRVLGPRAAEALAAPSPWPPAALGWVFLLVLPAIGLAVDRDPGLYFRRSYWFVGNAWAWVLAPWCAWCLGRHVLATLGVSRHFSAVASALPEVDLLDRRWLAPFASQALLSSIGGHDNRPEWQARIVAGLSVGHSFRASRSRRMIWRWRWNSTPSYIKSWRRSANVICP
jgi:hypothetical protein